MSQDFKASNFFLHIPACPPGEAVGNFRPTTDGTEGLIVGACYYFGNNCDTLS